MKKYLLIILLMPFLLSWKWPVHQSFVEHVYYNTDLKDSLDLNYLKQGSIAPDKDFRDYRNHHYPNSYNLTLLWLSRAEITYNEKNFKNASYSFGVAAHYISDSFVSPHYISKESSKMHSKFESQAGNLKTKCSKRQFNLKSELEKASGNGKFWDTWLETNNQEIVQKQAEDSLDLIYQVALDTFKANCKNNTTEFKKVYLVINKNVLMYSSAILTVLVILILRKPSND